MKKSKLVVLLVCKVEGEGEGEGRPKLHPNTLDLYLLATLAVCLPALGMYYC